MVTVGSPQLTVLARACWDGTTEPPALPGFVVSSFSPLVATVAEECLTKAFGQPPADSPRTAVLLVSGTGDVVTAVTVAAAVDAGKRVGPLLFFQSVPNAVAGHIAARWGLTGPVVCLSPVGEDPMAEGLALAALLIEDSDAERALVVHVKQACVEGERDSAEAVLVCAEVE
jgi:hypothetical protein